LCVSLLSALALVSLFDPQRVSRLFDVALNLKSVFADSPFVSWFGMNQGPGAPFEMEAVSLGNTLGLLGVMASLYYPHKLESADRIILWAASLSALLFASPFIGREWSQRLSLMAFAPGLAPLAFVSVRMRRGAAASLAIMSAVLWSTANNLPGIEPQTLSMPAYRELQSLRLSLPKGNVIVVARHGLEWWAAWAMNVKVANNLETVRDSWEKYDAVLTLDEIKPGAFTGRGRERPGVNRGEHRSFAGPPGFGGPDFRDPINGFPDWAGGPPRPEEGGPGFERDIEPALYPDMLEMITRGDYFRLSRVTEKPDGDVYGNHPRHR